MSTEYPFWNDSEYKDPDTVPTWDQLPMSEGQLCLIELLAAKESQEEICDLLGIYWWLGFCRN